MNEYTTIEVNEKERIVVYYDESPTCPRGDWDMMTGALTVNGDNRRMDVPTVHEFPGGRLAEAYETFQQGMNWNNAGVQQYDYENITIRWAKIFHGIHVEMIDGTFWWVDPAHPDFDAKRSDFEEWQRKVIAIEQQTYNDWAEGSVYGVVVEKLVHWARIDDNGEFVMLTEPISMDTWEEQESCWGYYLDHDRPEDEQFREFANEMYAFEEDQA